MESESSRTLLQQIEQIADAADDAKRRIDYDSAHDIEILSAIEIVEEFLQATGRICYGGAAMNAHLPDKYKFYDPKYTIPDYDFLTPNPNADIQNLHNRLRRAGFSEIGIRPGMHEGTTKIYINYVPIADVSAIHPQLYNMFKLHAIKVEGISYMDINSLRMMMYLELSRPRGEVARWSKVYERILLLESVLPPKECTEVAASKNKIPPPIYRSALRYLISRRRVIAGASVLGIYRESLRRKVKADLLFDESMPLIVYAPDVGSDEIEGLRELLGDVQVKKYAATGDFIPPMTAISYDRWPIILYVQETACHAYNTIELRDGEFIKIATLDTLITLYLSIMISGRKALKRFFPKSILCLANECIKLQSYMRRYPKATQFPFISLTCSGYQKGLPTLLKEKVERIQAAKAKRSTMKTRRTRKF